jgi:hypothetical protein
MSLRLFPMERLCPETPFPQVRSTLNYNFNETEFFRQILSRQSFGKRILHNWAITRNVKISCWPKLERNGRRCCISSKKQDLKLSLPLNPFFLTSVPYLFQTMSLIQDISLNFL